MNVADQERACVAYEVTVRVKVTQHQAEVRKRLEQVPTLTRHGRGLEEYAYDLDRCTYG